METQRTLVLRLSANVVLFPINAWEMTEQIDNAIQLLPKQYPKSLIDPSLKILEYRPELIRLFAKTVDNPIEDESAKNKTVVHFKSSNIVQCPAEILILHIKDSVKSSGYRIELHPTKEECRDSLFSISSLGCESFIGIWENTSLWSQVVAAKDFRENKEHLNIILMAFTDHTRRVILEFRSEEANTQTFKMLADTITPFEYGNCIQL